MNKIVQRYFANIKRVADQKKLAQQVYDRNKDTFNKLAK